MRSLCFWFVYFKLDAVELFKLHDYDTSIALDHDIPACLILSCVSLPGHAQQCFDDFYATDFYNILIFKFQYLSRQKAE